MDNKIYDLWKSTWTERQNVYYWPPRCLLVLWDSSLVQKSNESGNFRWSNVLLKKQKWKFKNLTKVRFSSCWNHHRQSINHCGDQIAYRRGLKKSSLSGKINSVFPRKEWQLPSSCINTHTHTHTSASIMAEGCVSPLISAWIMQPNSTNQESLLG